MTDWLTQNRLSVVTLTFVSVSEAVHIRTNNGQAEFYVTEREGQGQTDRRMARACMCTAEAADTEGLSLLAELAQSPVASLTGKSAATRPAVELDERLSSQQIQPVPNRP